MTTMEVRIKEMELSAMVDVAYNRLMENPKTDLSWMDADAEYRHTFKEWSRMADEALKRI
jgi:hypothetical protein